MIRGWDDAPLVRVKRSRHPKSLVTFVYPYYCNSSFLVHQIRRWSEYPNDLKQHLSVIIVDDGSPGSHCAELILKSVRVPFPVRLFRIHVDIRWNWLAARNIAMANAHGWCVATDMDHIIPPETAESLVRDIHDPKMIYRFSRAEHTGPMIHPHPNSWFMTREMFWKFGGYDEALSGYYGTDGEARRRWVKTAPVRTLYQKLIRHEYELDSSTTRYQRKESIDIEAQEMIKARGKNWQPRVLSFPFTEIML